MKQSGLQARVVMAEMLDGLDAQDPRAQRSRRDLQTLHHAMGTRRTLLQALRGLKLQHCAGRRRPALQVLELGAGDGSLMLGVARALHAEWPAVELSLLDRQSLLEPATSAAYAAVGWSAKLVQADALDWAAGRAPAGLKPPRAPRWDLVVTTLFLHHFQTAPLQQLLGAVAARSERFIACEPRRAGLAWLGSHAVGMLGANAVTRADAVLSVRAGFRGQELSTLWRSQVARWVLQERPAGLFSHAFVATRKPVPFMAGR